jgi:nuclear transport factor 2 (NTF2) superfamily protein
VNASNDARTDRLGTAKDGTPITEDLADELAREAEAGYDLRHARRVALAPTEAERTDRPCEHPHPA